MNRLTIAPTISHRDLQLQLVCRFVGVQFYDNLNTLPLPSYWQYDLNLSRSFSPSARWFITIENLTNTKIVVTRTPVDFLGTPFLIRAGMTVRLGSL